MISGTTRDYTFRKVDLSLFPDLESPDVAVEMRLGNPAKMITGHSKAAQNFLRALMTPLGHYRSNPDYGSEFSEKVYSGNIVFVEDLPNLFAIESLRIIDSIFADKGSDIPDDEVISRAELADFALSRSQLTLTINVYFRNEDAPKVLRLPVNIDRVA